jgi:hypothetical protein
MTLMVMVYVMMVMQSLIAQAMIQMYAVNAAVMAMIVMEMDWVVVMK